jgi:hypothetical protein
MQNVPLMQVIEMNNGQDCTPLISIFVKEECEVVGKYDNGFNEFQRHFKNWVPKYLASQKMKTDKAESAKRPRANTNALPRIDKAGWAAAYDND